uniref:Costars domain-containing protein n=1 Tax=Parascaris univalens TaxID=6257 RepID=A0A915BAN5_PARUN
MISSRQRGTAREAIAKFSNIAKEAENSTKSFGSRSVTTLRGSATDAIHKFNKTATTNDEKINNNDTTNSRELNSVRRRGGARDTIERFNRVAEINKEKLDKNPFSETYSIQHFDKNADDYGRPTRGSKTEARGIKAGVYISREVLFLCETIEANAVGEHPNRVIKFGPLFYTYAHYSDKLVGMLLRARKYKLVDFEGEMLYQGQDDDKFTSASTSSLILSIK